MEVETNVKVLVTGSNSSALDTAMEPLKPPATRTSPFWSSVMVKFTRGTFMLLIVVKRCVVGS